MILNEFFNLPQVFEKDMEKDTQVNGQDVDVNVVVEKLQQIAAHAKQQIQNADYDQQVRYATTVRDRALQALDMIAQGGNTPEAARSAFAFMQTGKQGVAEGLDPYRLERLDPQTRRVLTRMTKHAEPGSWLSAAESYAMQLGLEQKNENPRAWEQEVQHFVDLYRQYSGQGVAEAKDDYVPPKEADYGYEYQQMVRRVGQKAKQQEKAKQQQPKAPVRESRLALLKQIIQS